MSDREALTVVTSSDVAAVREFLSAMDLTLSGLDSPTVRLWMHRDGDGRIIGTTGYELSTDRHHALIRSVAIDPSLRKTGAGSELALFALDEASREGASTAWLFSRRSGPFWQKLGFAPADRHELAAVLSETHQVRLFDETGQLERETAWSRPL